MHQHIEEEEVASFDIKMVLQQFVTYRYTILLFLFFSAVGSGYYAYFQPNIYRATASVKIDIEKARTARDVVSLAMGNGALSESTEKDMILSNYLKEKALEQVDFSHHYFEVSHFKERELYKDSPFRVMLTNGFGLTFTLYPEDTKHFRLVVEGKDKEGKAWFYDKTLSYHTLIETPHFSLVVLKRKPLTGKMYRFRIDAKNRSTARVFVSQNMEHSAILRISVEDTVPLRAKEFAHALVEAYVKQSIESKQQKASARLRFIQSQLKRTKERLKASLDALESFRQSRHIVTVKDKMMTIKTQLKQYESELLALRLREALLKHFKEQHQKGKPLETLSLDGIVKANTPLFKTKQLLQDAILEKVALLANYTSAYPKVKNANNKIIQLQKVMLRSLDNLSEDIANKRRYLMQKIQEAKKTLEQLPQEARIYNTLEQEFKINETMHMYLLKKQSEAQMLQASTVSANRLLDDAVLPTSPVKPKRLLILFLGTLFGLFLGGVYVLIRLFLDNKIHSEYDIERETDTPLIGVIPHEGDVLIPERGVPKVLLHPHSIFAESFRDLRTNIQFMVQAQSHSVLLVTSTVGEEGKSTIASNLAGMMGLVGKRTLLINTDMRKATLDKTLKLTTSKGLSHLLIGELAYEDVVVKEVMKSVDVLGAGVRPPNPAELLQSQEMTALLEQMKEQYDVIILDSAPIGVVSDAKALIMQSNLVLYVTRTNYSKKVYLEELGKLQEQYHMNHIGIVLNDMPYTKGNYGYYVRSGYYEEA